MTNNYLPEIINAYSKLILAIEEDVDDDPLWNRFYQIQMASYFLSKKNLEFRLAEAEHAYNRILNCWVELRDYLDNASFPINNIDNIFKSIDIDMPSDELTISLSENNDFLFESK